MSAAIKPTENESNTLTIPIGSLEDKLRLAASKGQTDKVQDLIQSGASFDPDKNGRTALHYAALGGHLEACKLLVQSGCNKDDQDQAGCSPLQRAASQGHLEVITFLIGQGCSIEKQDEDGNAPIHEAAWNGFSKTIELLIKHNCNVYSVNKAGFTALHLSCQNGHNESCRIILYAGINVDLKNNYGDTALHTAARYGHAGVTRILISARTKLNEQNKNGDTALHIASALKRRKIAKLLVEAGIDITVRNKQNETAVDVARRKEHPDILVIITSLNRSKTPTHHTHHKNQGRFPVHKEVNFKEDIIDGPVIVPNDDLPIKSDKQEKQKKFFFFKKKKKEKEKTPDSKQVLAHSKDPNVQGFFSRYVPRPGVQYYRDLAGNIKQGPIGYTPVCQCMPVIKKLEQKVEANKENIYDHIDASHRLLKEKIDQLDHRATERVQALDRWTKDRLEQEQHNCHERIARRLEDEHMQKHPENTRFGVNEWIEAKLASYGHCLDHHHDDTALPNNNIFMDVHENENGRLFRSRSDETLSQSDNYSGKFRKKDFYESRQAAMQQMRAWQVPQYENRDRERGRQTQNLQQYKSSMREPGQTERRPMPNLDSRNSCNVLSNRIPNTQHSNVKSSDDPVYVSRHDYQRQGAIPKQVPRSQTWHHSQQFQNLGQREPSPVVHSTPKSRESSPFDAQASGRIVKSNTDYSGLNRFNQKQESFPERGSGNTNSDRQTPTVPYNAEHSHYSDLHRLNQNQGSFLERGSGNTNSHRQTPIAPSSAEQGHYSDINRINRRTPTVPSSAEQGNYSDLKRIHRNQESFPDRGSVNTNTKQTPIVPPSTGQGPKQHEQTNAGGKVKPPVPAKPIIKYETSRPSFTTFGYPEKNDSTMDGDISLMSPQNEKSQSVSQQDSTYSCLPHRSIQACSTPRAKENQQSQNRDDMYLSTGQKPIPRQRSRSSEGLLMDDITSAHEMAKSTSLDKRRVQISQNSRTPSDGRRYPSQNDNISHNNYNSVVPSYSGNSQFGQSANRTRQNFMHQGQDSFIQGQRSQNVNVQQGHESVYSHGGRFTRNSDGVYSTVKDTRQNMDRNDTRHVNSAVNHEIPNKTNVGDTSKRENPYVSAREVTQYRAGENYRDSAKDSISLHNSTNKQNVPYSSAYSVNKIGQGDNKNTAKSLSKSETNLDRSSDGSEMERNCVVNNNANKSHGQNMSNYPHAYTKEDLGSNPDSGYSSKIYGNRALTPGSLPSNSGTPSSSFSTDRSISTPSNCSPYTQVSSSDYEVMHPVNTEYQEQVQTHIQNWYQRKVQEAAHRLREGPYNDVHDNDAHNRYNVYQDRSTPLSQLQHQNYAPSQSQHQNYAPVYHYGDQQSQHAQQQYRSNQPHSDYQYLSSYVRGTDI